MWPANQQQVIETVVISERDFVDKRKDMPEEPKQVSLPSSRFTGEPI